MSRRRRTQAFLVGLGIGALFAGCGSAQPKTAAPAQSAGSELAAPRSSMEVSGLYGTIPQTKILATLEPRLPSFQRCFERAASERLEFIAGKVEFYFHVGLDGRVEWVFARASTVGDRKTEECLLGVASGARFPEPRGGGPAELGWGFEYEAPNVRPPVAWDSAEVAPIVDAARSSLAACDAANMQVTAYVAPGGQVMAAGAAASSLAQSEKIDCVLAQVATWTMPDPGSYPAKVTFALP